MGPKIFLLAASAVAISTTSYAADMAVKAPIKAPVADPWTGPYVGGNVGYSFGRWSSTNTAAGATSFFAATGLVSSTTPNVDGWIAGGQVGYNWRHQNWVFGLEGDLQWSGERASNGGTATLLTIPLADGTISLAGTVDNQWRLNWFGTLRPRAGILVDPTLLVYVTGGLAVASTKFSNSTTATATTRNGAGAVTATATATIANSETQTRAGWTLGAGAEKKISDKWSAKIEYLFLGLGTHTFLSGTTSTPVSVRLQDHIVRVGLNYKLN
ncbi:MAG: porin family protein [Pseudolabrys sp.]|nr:porin family protein [Pseudolabrys sp.]